MEAIRITTEICIRQIEGKQMPDEDTILTGILNYLTHLSINNATIVDMVHITHIDGVSTDEG